MVLDLRLVYIYIIRLITLNGMKASEELTEEQCRQVRTSSVLCSISNLVVSPFSYNANLRSRHLLHRIQIRDIFYANN